MELTYSQKKRLKWKEKAYELASLIALKYGGPGYMRTNRNNHQIIEMWEYEDPHPSLGFIKKAQVKEVKWFIRNRLSYKRDEIWNSDFLMGLSVHGTMFWNSTRYPSFYWRNNESIKQLIAISPFGGEIRKNSWLHVPAFYLKHSKDTLSYVTGILAGTQIVEDGGFQYALVNSSAIKAIRELKIPIDKINGFNKGESYLISPIWPALFSLMMPYGFREKFLRLSNPYGTEFYAPILWRTYVNNNNFIKEGIPYLQARRTVYNHFGNPTEDLATILGKMRAEKDLTELDNRVKEIVKIWAEKNV